MSPPVWPCAAPTSHLRCRFICASGIHNWQQRLILNAFVGTGTSWIKASLPGISSHRPFQMYYNEKKSVVQEHLSVLGATPSSTDFCASNVLFYGRFCLKRPFTLRIELLSSRGRVLSKNFFAGRHVEVK